MIIDRRKYFRWCEICWNYPVSKYLSIINNVVDEWHLGPSQLNGAAYPGIWEFTDTMKMEQSVKFHCKSKSLSQESSNST